MEQKEEERDTKKEKISVWPIRAFAAFMFLMIGYLGVNSGSFKQIKTQRELEMVLTEEAKKLELDTKKISISFGESPYDAHSQSIDDRYRIVLYQDRTRQTVKHEIYHIYMGDCNKDINKASELEKGIMEIRAYTYSFFEIKLNPSNSSKNFKNPNYF